MKTDRSTPEADAERLRAIFPKILEALGSGACSADCLIEFMEMIPAEVGLVVRKLKLEKDEAIERAESMGKLAHSNACEAMEYRRERGELRAELAAERALADRLAYSVQPFANYACNSDRPCRCHNCVARLALTAWKEARK